MKRVMSLVTLAFILLLSGCVTWIDKTVGEEFFDGEWKDEQLRIVTSLEQDGVDEMFAVAKFGLPHQEQEMMNFRAIGWSYEKCGTLNLNFAVHERTTGECRRYMLAVVFEKYSGSVIEYETWSSWEPMKIHQWTSEPLIQPIVQLGIARVTLDTLLNRVVERSDEAGRRFGDAAAEVLEESGIEFIENNPDIVDETREMIPEGTN